MIKKLAKWAGFKGRKFPNGSWMLETFEYTRDLNFPQSLDTCFKWLVPKLRESGLLDLSLTFSYLAPEVTGDSEDKLGYQCRLHLEKFILEPIYAYASTPALALCLAIEKLIDSENC